MDATLNKFQAPVDITVLVVTKTGCSITDKGLQYIKDDLFPDPEDSNYSITSYSGESLNQPAILLDMLQRYKNPVIATINNDTDMLRTVSFMCENIMDEIKLGLLQSSKETSSFEICDNIIGKYVVREEV